MANIAADITDWTLQYGAGVTVAWSDTPPDAVTMNKGALFIQGPQCTSPAFTMAIDSVYPVSVVVNPVTADGTLVCLVDDGSGGLSTLASKAMATFSGVETWAPGSITAVGSQGRVRFRLDGATNGKFLFLDSVDVDAPAGGLVAKTAAIRAAIVGDLNDIDGTGSFVTTLAEVGTEPKELDKVSAPACFLIPDEGGESETETLTNRKGVTVQTVTVQMFVRTATPHADIENLLDDVRNAVERTTSATNGVAGVSDVTVTDWSEILTSDDLSNQWGMMNATVSVEYVYNRGSA